MRESNIIVENIIRCSDKDRLKSILTEKLVALIEYDLESSVQSHVIAQLQDSDD